MQGNLKTGKLKCPPEEHGPLAERRKALCALTMSPTDDFSISGMRNTGRLPLRPTVSVSPSVFAQTNDWAAFSQSVTRSYAKLYRWVSQRWPKGVWFEKTTGAASPAEMWKKVFRPQRASCWLLRQEDKHIKQRSNTPTQAKETTRSTVCAAPRVSELKVIWKYTPKNDDAEEPQESQQNVF